MSKSNKFSPEVRERAVRMCQTSEEPEKKTSSSSAE